MLEKKTCETISPQAAEKHLRGVEAKDAILNRIKRVEVFKGTSALKHLMNIKHLTSTDAKDVMNCLLNNHYIARVRNTEDAQYCIDVAYDFNINHEYIWMVQNSGMYTLAIGIGLLGVAFTIALFPIWPRFAKAGTGYIFYVLLALLLFLLAISIIRLVVYIGVKVGTGKDFWIFPNLFEECGILESFVPLYGWGASSPHVKKE